MTGSTPTSTTDALTVVVRDFGRLVSTEPERLRGLLEDVLGTHARAERLHVDAVVLAAEQGVPAALMGDAFAPPVAQRELEARLTGAGAAQALATYGVGAWVQVLGAETSVVTVPEVDPTEPRGGRTDDTDRTVTPPAPGGLLLPPPGPPNGTPPRTALPAPPPGPQPTILVSDLDGDAPAPPPGPQGASGPASERRPAGRRRWLLVGAAAALVIAVVGVAVAVQHSGGGKAQAVAAESPATTSTSTTATTPTTVAPASSATTLPVTAPFPAESTPWGASLARTWTVQDGAVVGSLTFANPGTAPISGAQVEVIPKSIAANRAALTFSVEPTVITDDPVVQFDLTLAPGETKTITYQAALAAGLAPSAELLAGWMEEWKQAVAAYLASLDVTPPPLVIGAPLDGDTVDTTDVIVTGSSEPGAAVTVNGVAANVDPGGNWSIVYTLPGTDNPIAVEASDAKGNKATTAIVVHYAPPAPDPAPTATTKKPATNSPTPTPGSPTPDPTPTPQPEPTPAPEPEPAPAPPVARGDGYSWTADIDAGGSIYTRVLSVLANDSGSGIYISGTSGATHGSVSVSGGRIVYSPHHNGAFSDSFSYTITDANGNSSSASVSVSVGCNTSFQCYGS